MKTCPVCKTEFEHKGIMAEGREVCCDACSGYLEEAANRLNESESIDSLLEDTQLID